MCKVDSDHQPYGDTNRIWRQHLSGHFGKMSWQEYEPQNGHGLSGIACRHAKQDHATLISKTRGKFVNNRPLQPSRSDSPNRLFHSAGHKFLLSFRRTACARHQFSTGRQEQAGYDSARIGC